MCVKRLYFLNENSRRLKLDQLLKEQSTSANLSLTVFDVHSSCQEAQSSCSLQQKLSLVLIDCLLYFFERLYCIHEFLFYKFTHTIWSFCRHSWERLLLHTILTSCRQQEKQTQIDEQWRLIDAFWYAFQKSPSQEVQSLQ